MIFGDYSTEQGTIAYIEMIYTENQLNCGYVEKNCG